MKALVIVILLLLTVGRVDATAPNTGPVPEFCVKLEFSDKSVTGVEPSSWELLVTQEDVTIINGDVIIKLFDFVFKDKKEIIGFSWTITGARADFTVKHGRTVLAYNNEFITTDRKGVSNAVWCLEELEDSPVEDPEEEDPDIDEPPVDEPPVEDPDDEEPEAEEPPVEEPESDDEEPEVEEPPVDDEPEVDDDDEPLPQTSDAATTSLNLFILLLGLILTVKSLD